MFNTLPAIVDLVNRMEAEGCSPSDTITVELERWREDPSLPAHALHNTLGAPAGEGLRAVCYLRTTYKEQA